jgi:peptidoglycan hydrolase-like protein with peptidoglycan-binding domain
VRAGERGEVVTTVQYLLRAHGHDIAVDGVFGPQTLEAVRAFQRAGRLTVDGVVGAQTWAALFVTVQQGSQGEAVRAVQGQLASRGVAITVDGDFGPQTDAAVRAYQQRTGLSADGVVGPQTWSALVSGR